MPYPINDTMLGGVSGMFSRVTPPLLGRPEGRPVGAATGTGVQPVGFQNPMLQGLSRAGMGSRQPMPVQRLQNPQRKQMLAQQIMQKYGMIGEQGGQYGI